MSKPQNPETVVIRNKYYPKGLREIDIWDYYQKVKPQILQETINRDLMFYINVDVNKPIIRRKSGEEFIRLTPKNYDAIITGRTVSIHSAMGRYERFGIIDVDVDPRDGMRWAIDATGKTYEYVMDKMPIVRTAQIRYTGKSSFHIKCDFGRRYPIDNIRDLLARFLRMSPLSKVYTIEGKRKPGIPNLDMAPNKFRGNYITLNSLSILGLKCMEIPYNKLYTFNERLARI